MNDKNPLVSIITPTYNYGAYIAQAIESVEKQTFTDYEMIVVDDGSTDNTREEVAKYPWVRYFYQENKGVGAARELARINARGKYIAYIDADDMWHPDKLKRLMEYFDEHPECRIVFSAFENFYEKPELENDPVAKTVFDITTRNYLTSCVMEASLFEEFGGFDTSTKSSDDTLLLTKLCINGIDTNHFVPETLNYRRLHGKNIMLNSTRSEDENMMKNIFKQIRERRKQEK